MTSDSNYWTHRRIAWVLTLVVAMACPRTWGAQSGPPISLATTASPGDVDRVEVGFQVAGHLRLPGEQAQQLPMSVVAHLAYGERRVRGTTARDGALRSLRSYEDAQAVVKIDTGGERPALDPQRRLIGVDYVSSKALIYCPTALVTREELDVIDIPANSLIVEELLPAGPVAPGDRWKHADQLLAALLGLDAVSLCDVESTLGEVKENTADVALGGFVGGAVAGVATEIELKGKYRFDRQAGRITWFALVLREKRAVGHVGPGLEVTAKLTMQITPGAPCEALTDDAVAGLPPVGAPQSQVLAYELPRGRLRFAYDRRWHVTSAENTKASLRLVDRGELIAQCNVGVLSRVPANGPTTLGEFQADVQKALDKNFGQFVNAREATDDAGRTIYRVVALGEVSELPIQWIYYLITDEGGQRVSVAFTLEPDLLPRFADADAQLVAALQLVEPAESADEPTPAQPPSKSPPDTARRTRPAAKR